MYASVLNKLHMNERALEFAKKGVKLAKSNNDFEYLFRLWAQMSVIYESLNDISNAERYFLKAMDLEYILQGKEELFPFAYVHFTKLLIGKYQWEKARQLIERSILICRKIKDNWLLVQSLLVYGEWFIRQNQHNQALSFCLEAEQIAKEYRFEELLKKSISCLCTCFDALQDNDNFLKYATQLYRSERS
jgi:tetratricopeptide (TPR) repeat protein